jgi:hypothetical protein
MSWEMLVRKLRRQQSNLSGGIPAQWENGRMKPSLLAVLKRKHVVAGDYASSASLILSKREIGIPSIITFSVNISTGLAQSSQAP